MKNVKLITILTLLLNISYCIYAKNNSKDINFCGKIKDSKARNFTEIMVNYNSDDGFVQTKRITFLVKINKSGFFKFSLPDLGKPYKIFFGPYSPNVKVWTGEYYVESGDDINVLLNLGTSNTVFFSGQGADKYNLIEKLNKQYWISYYQELRRINSQHFENVDGLVLKLGELTNSVRSFEKRKIDLINDNKNEITPIMKHIIKYEFASYYQDWLFRINILYKENAVYRRQISENYKKQIIEFFYDPTSESQYCPKYIFNLAQKIKFDLKVGELGEDVDIVKYYDSIKGLYSGVIRDRLLGVFGFSRFNVLDISPFKPETMDSLIGDAQKIVSVPYLKRAFIKKNRVKKGTKLLSSHFFDLNGGTFDANVLKGKVILIDVWFLGCSGCAAFHKKFETNIYPLLKSNKNFSVLSINVDVKKNDWLKGIDSKLYTSEHYINVTTGNGLDHPFTKYYNVLGGPWLMLVDTNGNIYAKVEVIQALDSTYICSLIEDALKSKNEDL